MLRVVVQGCDPPCLPPCNNRSLPCQAYVKWYRSQSLPHFSFVLVMHRVCIHGLQQRAGEDKFCPAKPLPCRGCALPWGQAAVLHQRSALVNAPNAVVTFLLPQDRWVCSGCFVSAACVWAKMSCSLGPSPLWASW